MKRLTLLFLFAVELISITIPAESSAADGGCPSVAAIAREVMNRVNALRAAPRRCGHEGFGPAGPLKWNNTLLAAAGEHAKGMSRNSYFAHRGHNGSTPGDRITEAGYSWSIAGENIAWGQRTVAHVIKLWIGSPDHCANIMNARFVELAVACSVNGQPQGHAEPYWDMVLAAPWPRAETATDH